MAQKLVTLQKVAQDGVRAAAGGGSFRRRDSLERCLVEADEQVKRLSEERDHAHPEVGNREQAARERAVRERLERLEAALRELSLVQAANERQQRTLNKAKRSKITKA